MEAIVHVSKAALDYFRQKARSSPNEIQAYLVGDVYYNPHHIHVTSIEHAREYEIQTPCNVQPTGEEYDRVRKLAVSQGHRIVGDIHSHPNWDPIMSPPDYQSAIEDGCHVCAIVGVRKKRTKVLFWLMGSALPCEVVYGSYTPATQG
jgi:proteasome lid subunit RPN8/RPN11